MPGSAAQGFPTTRARHRLGHAGEQEDWPIMTAHLNLTAVRACGCIVHSVGSVAYMHTVGGTHVQAAPHTFVFSTFLLQQGQYK